MGTCCGTEENSKKNELNTANTHGNANPRGRETYIGNVAEQHDEETTMAAITIQRNYREFKARQRGEDPNQMRYADGQNYTESDTHAQEARRLVM